MKKVTRVNLIDQERALGVRKQELSYIWAILVTSLVTVFSAAAGALILSLISGDALNVPPSGVVWFISLVATTALMALVAACIATRKDASQKSSS